MSKFELHKFDKKYSDIVTISSIAIGFLFLVIPNSWAGAFPFDVLGEWVKSYWPKMQSDFDNILLYHGPAQKYVLVNIFMIIFYSMVFSVGAISFSKRKSPPGDLYPLMDSYTIIVSYGFLLVLLYLMMFDQSMASSDARRARSIFRSVLCLFWPPLEIGVIGLILLRLFCHYYQKIINKSLRV